MADIQVLTKPPVQLETPVYFQIAARVALRVAPDVLHAAPDVAPRVARVVQGVVPHVAAHVAAHVAVLQLWTRTWPYLPPLFEEEDKWTTSGLAFGFELLQRNID